MAGMFMATVAASTYTTTSTSVATGCAVYQSVIPTLDVNHVKATTTYVPNSEAYPHFTCDPASPLVGTWQYNQWLSQGAVVTNQKFNIDIGSSNIIKRIYYENGHYIGKHTGTGANHVSAYGSNDVTAFNNTTFSSITGLNILWSGVFSQHVGDSGDTATPDQNIPDPHYIDLPYNTTSYQYYIFRIADNYGSVNWMSIRRIELQKCGA
jgi:hypothetical protein